MNKIHLRTRRTLKLDRALSGGMWHQIFIYLLAVTVTFLLLFGIALLLRIPLSSNRLPEGGLGKFWTMLFFFYNGELEWTTPGNRWFVYLVNILGSILMGGVLIATITNYLLSSRDKAEKGLLRYRLANHTVFIGFHESMIPLVQAALDNNEYAVILSELPFSDAKDRIVPYLKGGVDSKRLVVYHGQRTSLEDLNSLCLNDAREVFIFPEPSFSDTDSINLDVVDQISDLYKNKDGKRLKCTALFQEDSVVACFERSDINDEVRQKLDFTPIIYGDAITQALLSGSAYGNEFLDREALTPESTKRVHLFILGLQEIGQALFVQAVRYLHFPNYEKAKSTITLVGEQSDIDALKARYREFFAVADNSSLFSYLGDILDISVQTIPAERVQDIDSAMNEAVNNPDELVTVAICMENSPKAQDRAISLPRSIYEKSVPIWLYKPDSDALVKMIGKDSFYSNIVIFGEPDKLFGNQAKQSIANSDLLRAQRINWVYSVYSSTNAIPASLPSHEEWERIWVKKWDEVRIRNKWSNLNNAYSIPVKLRSLGISAEGVNPLTDQQIEILSRVEQNRWVAETLLGGYRPATEPEREKMVNDRTLKTVFKKENLVHLDLCRFDDLLPDEHGVDVRDYSRAIIKSIPLILQ